MKYRDAYLTVTIELQVLLRLHRIRINLLRLWLDTFCHIRTDLLRPEHPVRVETIAAVVGNDG